jgi:hypothetical protein
MADQSSNGTARQPYSVCADRSVQIFKLKYPCDGEKTEMNGILVYVKLTVPADAPWDLQEYMKADAVFPHDSTADQFFDETRFLRYVALGKHCGNQAVTKVSGLLSKKNDQNAKSEFADCCGTLISNNRWKQKRK